MRIRVLLLPSSIMPLTVHFCLVVATTLLLLCSSTPCLGTLSQDCLSDTCGGFPIGYPFGTNDEGCGDPDFQLECPPDDQYPHQYPLLKIGGDDYSILTPSYLASDSNHNSMTIVKGNPSDNCNFSANYSPFWSSGSHFQILNTYTNVTLWQHCDQNPWKDFRLCGEDWYYSSNLPKMKATPSCDAFQLPIKKSHLYFINETVLEQGFEITWNVEQNRYEKCGVCQESKGICGYKFPESFLCHCPDGKSHLDKCPGNGGRSKSIIIGCSIGGAALIAIAVVLFLRFYAKRTKTLSRGLASGDMEAAILPRREIGNLPIFSYEELRQATNCFHEQNELGDGGFGSVYLGKLRDGRTVAVKRLYQDNSRRLEQFINEVQIFSTLNHPRVVRLYGCTSADSPELLLVYEFVSNGTLADHLHGDRRGPRGLPWEARLNIANQTAEALAFLHSVDPPIFHRDVKSSNILLDENFDVKVADFGLCRLVPVNASHVTTAPQGTPGYVDPEYHQCYQLTEKSDVYSFGVVLVEIISAKLAVDINRNRREISLANMAKSKIQEGALHELVDPQLEIEMNHEVKVTVTAVAELALRCLGSERDDRPHMKEVVAQLSEIRQSWDTSTGAGEQQWGSFSNIKQPISPISVQDQWSSISSTPNTSA